MSLSQTTMASPKIRSGLSTTANFLWVASGNAIYSACSLLMVVVVAKMGGERDLGMFSFGLALAQPVIFLSQLNLSNILAVDVKQSHPIAAFFSLRLTASMLAMLAVLLYTLVAIHDRTTQVVVLIIMASSLVDSISEVEYGLFRLRARMNLVSISLVVRGVLSLAGVIAGLVWFHSIVVSVALSALASLVTTCFIDTGMLKSALTGEASPYFWQWGIRKPVGSELDLAKLAWPLGLVMMLASLTVNIPRYVVDGSLGHSQLGLFSALASFATIGRIVVLAMGQAATPKLSTAFVENNQKSFVNVSIKLLGLGIAIGLGGIALVAAVGPQMLRAAFTKEYSTHGPLFLAIIAASAIGYLGNVVGFILTSAKVFRPQLPHLLSVVLVTAVFSYLLIPRLGLLGAAWAIGIASVWQIASGLGILAWTLRRAQPEAA